MLHVSFNQDSTCFACGTDQGFAVYNCDPPTERFSRIEKESIQPNGIGIVEMLFRSNIFALVGGGDHPKYAKNMLMIWDDFQGKCIAELEFKSQVTGVRLRRDMILVTIIDKAYIYNFTDLHMINSYDTHVNKNGLCALTSGTDAILAIPDAKPGSVKVIHHLTKKELTIEAHTSPLAVLCLNSEGTKLATVSERGTLIRVWDTRTGAKLRELRRGVEPVVTTSLCFDLASSRIAMCSDKGTVHIFSLADSENTNRRSTLMYISDYLPQYFSSEWSTVSFTVTPGSVCAFGPTPDTLYVVDPTGGYSKYSYNTIDGNTKCSDQIKII